MFLGALLCAWLVLPEGPLHFGPERAWAQDAPPPAPLENENETEQARGLPIGSIKVAGNRRITSEDIVAYLTEKVGQAFSPEALSKDVRELWNSGFFDDIEVDLERADGKVSLRFLVRERPNISAIEFEGNNEIDADDLKEAIEVKANSIISYPAIQRSIQKIRDKYAEQGYFLAEATEQVIPQKNNEVKIKFKVVEHGRVSVRRVTFIGNTSVTSDELRAVMYTGNPGFFAFGSGGPFRQDAFERDMAVISALYYDRGYLQVSINTPRIMLTPDRNGMELSITIDEGPRYKIRRLRVFERDNEGKEVEPIGGRKKLRGLIRADSGDYFNRAELLEDLQAVRTLYRDEGYANVLADPETTPDPATQEVDVVVPIQRGPLVHFGRIEVQGNTKTRDKVIRRELEIVEGDKFSESKLERSRRRVTALGYFERVDLTTQNETEDTVGVMVEVAEKPTGTFQVGAGFSSIENFIATAQIQQANLFGNGQTLSFNGQLSGIRMLVNLRYYEPYLLDSSVGFTTDLFDQLRVYNDFSQRTRGGALTFGYPLIDPELGVSLTYSLQEDTVSTETTSTFLQGGSSLSAFNRLPLANLFNDGVTSSLRPAVTYDTRDNRLFPTSGIYLYGSTELALSALGSTNEFLRTRYTGRFYYPITTGLVLKLNTEAGLITSPSADGVPIFARFFLGGIVDVRGFRFRSIGPRVPLTESTDPNSPPIFNGANIGGNLMFYDNLELEFSILDDVGIKGVVFTDAGNAWNLEGVYCHAGARPLYDVVDPCFSFPSDLLNLRTSWGFGLRWFSPLGPLRFEWGFPFKPLPYEETRRFEFTIGNFF
ncbi:MAG TPA: outer membrane protein assembly factor BamA [Polyangiaceae bacterium]|nr:outer membrane protein assembly factor BamA [Polyangiaceae bacterium]